MTIVCKQQFYTLVYTYVCKIIHTGAYNFTHRLFLHTGPEAHMCVSNCAHMFTHSASNILHTVRISLHDLYNYTHDAHKFAHDVYNMKHE
jgi:hypothetical protein